MGGVYLIRRIDHLRRGEGMIFDLSKQYKSTLDHQRHQVHQPTFSSFFFPLSFFLFRNSFHGQHSVKEIWFRIYFVSSSSQSNNNEYLTLICLNVFLLSFISSASTSLVASALFLFLSWRYLNNSIPSDLLCYLSLDLWSFNPSSLSITLSPSICCFLSHSRGSFVQLILVLHLECP